MCRWFDTFAGSKPQRRDGLIRRAVFFCTVAVSTASGVGDFVLRTTAQLHRLELAAPEKQDYRWRALRS
jgi:hypothetical protein